MQVPPVCMCVCAFRLGQYVCPNINVKYTLID